MLRNRPKRKLTPYRNSSDPKTNNNAVSCSPTPYSSPFTLITTSQLFPRIYTCRLLPRAIQKAFTFNPIMFISTSATGFLSTIPVDVMTFASSVRRALFGRNSVLPD